jgi:hypothetical protein
VALHFLFVQFEFTHALGPHAGRYVIDNGDGREFQGTLTEVEARNFDLAGVTRRTGATDVLVVAVTRAPAGKLRILRKARPVELHDPPAEVPLAMISLVEGSRPCEYAEAQRRFEALASSLEDQDRLVATALAVLNKAIRGYRAGTRDPYAIEVTRRDARKIRVGFGSTEEVADGRWTAAVELPPPPGGRISRADRLRPEEAVAAVLSSRTTVLESEDLVLRALIDLDNGRTRAAAYQVGAAMRLLEHELSSAETASAADIEKLAARAPRVGELEAAAAQGQLSTAEIADLEGIIEFVHATLDAWRYAAAE